MLPTRNVRFSQKTRYKPKKSMDERKKRRKEYRTWKKGYYHLCTDGGTEDMLWLRASASMPVVSRPVKIHDMLLLDGGIADAVPYAFMEAQGYSRNVLILTQPKGYRKKPTAGMKVIRILLRKYPSVSEAMAVRHQMYNRQMEDIDRREAAGTYLFISPPHPLKIGHTEKNPDELKRVYQIGIREAERRLDDIRTFLAES